MGSPFYVEIYDPNKLRVEGPMEGMVGEPMEFDSEFSDICVLSHVIGEWVHHRQDVFSNTLHHSCLQLSAQRQARQSWVSTSPVRQVAPYLLTLPRLSLGIMSATSRKKLDHIASTYTMVAWKYQVCTFLFCIFLFFFLQKKRLLSPSVQHAV